MHDPREVLGVFLPDLARGLPAPTRVRTLTLAVARGGAIGRAVGRATLCPAHSPQRLPAASAGLKSAEGDRALVTVRTDRPPRGPVLPATGPTESTDADQRGAKGGQGGRRGVSSRGDRRPGSRRWRAGGT